MTVSEAIEYLKQLNNQNEPVFVLRGRDTLAESVILFWVREAIRCGVPTMKIHGATGIANACREWPNKKIPD